VKVTHEAGVPKFSFGWSRGYLETLTSALMAELGVTEAVTCASGNERLPKELWSATDIDLVRLSVVGDWDGVEATVTPWRDVRGLVIRTQASEREPDPTATLTLVLPALEVTVLSRSPYRVGPLGQQWPFVRAVLLHLGPAKLCPDATRVR
jgi:hypothetical protein